MGTVPCSFTTYPAKATDSAFCTQHPHSSTLTLHAVSQWNHASSPLAAERTDLGTPCACTRSLVAGRPHSPRRLMPTCGSPCESVSQSVRLPGMNALSMQPPGLWSLTTKGAPFIRPGMRPPTHMHLNMNACRAGPRHQYVRVYMRTSIPLHAARSTLQCLLRSASPRSLPVGAVWTRPHESEVVCARPHECMSPRAWPGNPGAWRRQVAPAAPEHGHRHPPGQTRGAAASLVMD